MTPVSAALVIGAFAAAERGRAMAIYAGISQVFLAIGPLVGGLLTEYASWRFVFWLNVPIGIAALLLVRIARPDNSRRSEATIKAALVALLVAGVGATVLGIARWACAPGRWRYPTSRTCRRCPA
jgi:MFS family permease